MNVILGILIVIATWWVIAEVIIYVKGADFPRPFETFEALWNALNGSKINGENIFTHTNASLYRWGLGYIIALVLGIVIGFLFGTIPRLHETGMIPVYIMQMIPGLAWVPIAMLIFGLGETSTVFIILVTALPPIVINTAGGMRQVPPIYTRVAQMSGRDSWALFFKVLLPGAALSIINGMRVGLANGWRVLIAAEMVVGVSVGLGASIFNSRYSLNFIDAFVCIIVICAIGLIIEKLFFVWIENMLRNRLGLDRED
ncbi:MAG: ABC transporter permease [Methanomassiliicoccales archaeon]|nr:ABC transporter permease [Methanomassiliicoccales archaeon]